MVPPVPTELEESLRQVLTIAGLHDRDKLHAALRCLVGEAYTLGKLHRVLETSRRPPESPMGAAGVHATVPARLARVRAWSRQRAGGFRDSPLFLLLFDSPLLPSPGDAPLYSFRSALTHGWFEICPPEGFHFHQGIAWAWSAKASSYEPVDASVVDLQVILEP